MHRGIVLLFLVSVSAANPGLVASVALSAIEEFKTQAIPVFLSQIGDISIPNQSDNIGGGFFGINVNLSGITVSGISADATSTAVSFSAPNVISVHLAGLQATTTFNWGFKMNVVSGSGNGNVQISNTDVYASISLGENNGHCTITIDSASANIGNLDIHIGGNPLSTVENWIIGLFNNDLKGTIQSAIGNAIQQSGQQAIDQLLSQFGVSVPIGNTGFGIDYDLVVPPDVESDHITVSSLALFLDVANPNYNPPIDAPVTLPAYNPSGDQVQIAISDYTMNSGLYAAYASGALKYTVTPSMVPSSSPVQLDTTSLDSLFPGIEAAYGAGLPCNVACSAGSSAPVISTLTGDITGTAVANCAILVQGTTQALALAIDLAFNATISLNSWEVKGNVNSASVTNVTAYANAMNSAVDTNGLTFMLNLGLGLAVPYLDQTILGPGIQLPHIQNLDLSDGSVTVGQGYIFIEATPTYVITSPPASKLELPQTWKLVYE